MKFAPSVEVELCFGEGLVFEAAGGGGTLFAFELVDCIEDSLIEMGELTT